MISNHDAELIAQIDACYLKEEDTKKYVTINLYQYYTGINVWVFVLKAYSEIASKILESEIKKRGLLVVLKRADEAATCILRNEDIGDPLFATVCRGLTVADSLQVLRFLKRFSVVSTALSDDAQRKLLQTNNRIKLLNRRPSLPSFMTMAVKDEFLSLITDYSVDFSEMRLSNGASYLSRKAPKTGTGTKVPSSHKGLKRLDYNAYNLGDISYPYSSKLTYTHYMGVEDYGPLHGHSKYSSVPKSYKTYRTIAVETVTNQSRQQAIRVGLEKTLDINAGDSAPIYDQSVNGILANKAGYSTIDLSSASDSISFWLLGLIAPDSLFNDIWFARSAFLDVDNRSEVLHMVCTMGNGFCFALETLIFLSICRAATGCACRMLSIDEAYDVTSYGDDMIVPDWAYDTCVDWLTSLGFIVNDDKSYSDDDPFRESCGFDWYEGQYVTSTYWPRKVVLNSPDAAPYLTALQNRLFERGQGYFYFDAQTFLASQVHRFFPKLSEVDLDTYLEYNLDGRCLISITADRLETLHYHRDYGLKVGDGKSYDEERLYINALVPGYDSYQVDTERVHMAIYVDFLRHGPRYETPLDSILGVSTSYYSGTDDKFVTGVAVARIRLI